MTDSGKIALALADLGFGESIGTVRMMGAVPSLVFSAATQQQQRTDMQAALDGLDLSDAGEAARQAARNRTDGATEFLQSTPLGQILRAEALVLMDEINLLRGWITSFKSAVAASTSLADLKTRVAALDNLPQRTAAQAKNAIVAKAQDAGTDA